MRHRPIEDRFSEKYIINPDTQCWEWTGSTVRGGYGTIWRYQSRPILAHRFSYEHHKGPVPEGKIVRHTCHNSRCVNPAHLILGTHEENMADMKAAGRRLGRNSGSALLPKTLRRMRHLLALGYTQREVASELGVHRSTVQRAEYRGDIVMPVPTKRRRVYLTDIQRGEAIDLLEAGERVMAVAKRFGVDRKTIRNLRPSTVAPPPMGRPKKVD